MSDKLVTLVLGTARVGRESEKVAKFILARAAAAGLTVELADVKNYALTRTQDAGSKQWAEQVAKSAALIIVTPEYNFSFPGELKMLLDGAYAEYAGKPVGIVGVSSGPFGGARMAEHLILLCAKFQMLALPPVYSPKVAELFASPEPNDPKYIEAVDKMIASLVAKLG